MQQQLFRRTALGVNARFNKRWHFTKLPQQYKYTVGDKHNGPDIRNTSILKDT
jgi:hypothetical protein